MSELWSWKATLRSASSTTELVTHYIVARTRVSAQRQAKGLEGYSDTSGSVGIQSVTPLDTLEERAPSPQHRTRT